MTIPFRTLNLYQGQTFRTEIAFLSPDGTPIEMAGRQARMQARESIESPVAILDLSTDQGTLELDPGGIVRFNLTAAQTAQLGSGSHDVEQWVFDLELFVPGAVEVVRRVLTGVIVFWPEITRTEVP